MTPLRAWYRQNRTLVSVLAVYAPLVVWTSSLAILQATRGNWAWVLVDLVQAAAFVVTGGVLACVLSKSD